MNTTFSQGVCQTPPLCIQNSTINGGPTSGDLNTSAGTTVPNWFVSHGTPSYSNVGTLWLWSKNSPPNGEGVFACYNFIANQRYEVCLSARWDNLGQAWNQSGTMNLLAANGLNVGSTVTTSQASIGTTNMTSTLWANYVYNFTSVNPFSQLWIYPTLPNPAARGNQFNLQIDNIIVKDVTPPTVTVTGNTYNLTGGPLTGGAWNWSTTPSTTTGTGNNFTITAPASGSLIVNAVYVDPCFGGCGTRVTYSDTIYTDTCDDICYWRVTGNDIYGTNNKFGTNTNHDVRVFTDNAYRGIITNTGEWGMGQGAALTPNAKLHVDNSQWGQGHIDVSGKYPSVKLYENSTALGNPVARFGLATSNGGWTSSSDAGDVILQNVSRENSLIFGTNVNSTGTNGLERMQIDKDGQVGINMPNSNSAFEPTAYLHVACQGGNSDKGGVISDVRFERLEPGKGTLLVIDSNGYVYNSGQAYTSGGSGNSWLLNGNTNGAINWIGTNDNFDFPFHTNGSQKMNLTTSGALQIGNNPGSTGSANLAVGNLNSISNNSNSSMTFGWNNNLRNVGAVLVGGQNNIAANPAGNTVTKGIALGWANRIQTHNQYLIGASNVAGGTSEYCGAFGVGLTVNQSGTWYFGGDNGTGLTNNTSNTLAIGWGSRHSSLFTNEGLSLGTATTNTTNTNDLATARLDVESSSYSNVDGVFRASGVRFRNLPTNTGTILVRQDDGYVYDSEVHIEDILGVKKELEEEKTKNVELMETVNDLAERLEKLAKQMEELNGQKQDNSQSEFKIFPNPNSGNFMVKHFIPLNAQDSYLVITNLEGKEIMKLDINCVGLCTSNINLNSNIDNGTYTCTLYVDGKLVTSDRFIVTK